MQLFAVICNATTSQTLHFYQADFIKLQNSNYFKEMKKACCSVRPYPDKALRAFSSIPAQGCPVTVLEGRDGTQESSCSQIRSLEAEGAE